MTLQILDPNLNLIRLPKIKVINSPQATHLVISNLAVKQDILWDQPVL